MGPTPASYGGGMGAASDYDSSDGYPDGWTTKLEKEINLWIMYDRQAGGSVGDTLRSQKPPDEKKKARQYWYCNVWGGGGLPGGSLCGPAFRERAGSTTPASYEVVPNSWTWRDGGWVGGDGGPVPFTTTPASYGGQSEAASAHSDPPSDCGSPGGNCYGSQYPSGWLDSNEKEFMQARRDNMLSPNIKQLLEGSKEDQAIARAQWLMFKGKRQSPR